jgi:hypothetical protein
MLFTSPARMARGYVLQRQAPSGCCPEVPLRKYGNFASTDLVLAVFTLTQGSAGAQAFSRHPVRLVVRQQLGVFPGRALGRRCSSWCWRGQALGGGSREVTEEVALGGGVSAVGGFAAVAVAWASRRGLLLQ